LAEAGDNGEVVLPLLLQQNCIATSFHSKENTQQKAELFHTQGQD